MVDPLFQNCLVEISRQRKIPVIFDEVFTGVWRLGAPSAAEILGLQPDIACYAKLLTGAPSEQPPRGCPEPFQSFRMRFVIFYMHMQSVCFTTACQGIPYQPLNGAETATRGASSGHVGVKNSSAITGEEIDLQEGFCRCQRPSPATKCS